MLTYAHVRYIHCEKVKFHIRMWVLFWEIGNLLRGEIRLGTELGAIAQEVMTKGDLLPDELMIAIVKKRLMQDDCKMNGWILDGFPRTVQQAKMLEVIHQCMQIYVIGTSFLVSRQIHFNSWLFIENIHTRLESLFYLLEVILTVY